MWLVEMQTNMVHCSVPREYAVVRLSDGRFPILPIHIYSAWTLFNFTLSLQHMYTHTNHFPGFWWSATYPEQSDSTDRCQSLEFLATQCSVYVVAGFLLSASKDSPLRCVISSLTLNAILELSFCTVPLQQFLWQRHLNHIHSFIQGKIMENALSCDVERLVFNDLLWDGRWEWLFAVVNN